MRIQFSDPSRPKQAAKNLARLPGAPALSAIQAALARTLGYRDWRDFDENPGPDTIVSPTGPDAPRVIANLAEQTGLPDADIQYALSKARLFGSAPWTVDEQLDIRAKLWRARLFGPPGRGKSGTVVRDQASKGAPAYLLVPGKPTTILSDTQRTNRADFEVTTPQTPLADFVPSRLWLPYGMWTLKDDSEVLFSRDYYPLWRIEGERVERLDPWLWIDAKMDETHFAPPRSSVWASGPARDAALAKLARHRIADVPRLADIMAHLIDRDLDTFGAAVARLRAGSYPDTLPPDFARINEMLRYD